MIDIRQCPSCFEWHPIENMESVVTDEGFCKTHIQLADGNYEERYMLRQFEHLFCKECIGRIEARL